MADESELTAAVIFATDESLAAAVARAQRGNQLDARLLLERYVDRSAIGQPIGPVLFAYVAGALWPLLYDRRHNVRLALGLDAGLKRRPITLPRPPVPSTAQHMRVPVHAHAPAERLLARWCDDALSRREPEGSFSRTVARALRRLLGGDASHVVIAELGLVGGQVSERRAASTDGWVLEATKGRPDELEDLRWTAASMVVAGESDVSISSEVGTLLKEHRERHDQPGRERTAASERGTLNGIILAARQEVFRLAIEDILEVRRERLVIGDSVEPSLDPSHRRLALAYASASNETCAKVYREASLFLDACAEVDRQYGAVAWEDDADITVAGESTTWQEWSDAAARRTGLDAEGLLELSAKVAAVVLAEAERHTE